MIFYVLDAEWDKNKNIILGEFLSSANPFFDGLSSAVPEIYDKFASYLVPTNMRGE